MKTSVIDVRDMLSVLSVLGVEQRIGEVPGVERVTVNTLLEAPQCAMMNPDSKSGISNRTCAKAHMRPPRTPPLQPATVT